MQTVTTLNINGIRAGSRKGFFQWLQTCAPDVVCLQEIKAQLHQLRDLCYFPPGYHSYFHAAQKPGYSGVAIYTREQPQAVQYGIGWPDFDAEGRFLRIDFADLSIVSLYLPSGSSKSERQDYKMRILERLVPVLNDFRSQPREFILCGDWNIAHQQIDLKNWRSNQDRSGFLPEERAWMDGLFGALGWMDGFRVVDAQPDQYTWWSNRGQAWDRNVGWRIDYQVVTPGLGTRICDAEIYKDQRFSDHAPLTLRYRREGT